MKVAAFNYDHSHYLNKIGDRNYIGNYPGPGRHTVNWCIKPTHHIKYLKEEKYKGIGLHRCF